MIELNLDLSEFTRAARQMQAAQDQVPFALSQAMNEAVKATRRHEIDVVWPRSVTVRNRSFIGAALRMEFANKRNLSVAIYDRLGRGHLKLHDKGGVKRGRGKLAIPSSNVKRTARGVSAGQKPRTMPDAFRVGDSIFQRLRSGRMQLMFTLKPAAQIKADVPFSNEFAVKMRDEIRRAFGPAMLRAMRTRR